MDSFRTDQLRLSFFIDSVIKWNHLPGSIVHVDSLENFKSALLKLLQILYYISETRYFSCCFDPVYGRLNGLIELA